MFPKKLTLSMTLDNGQHKKKSIKAKSTSNNNTKRSKDDNLGAKESKNTR